MQIRMENYSQTRAESRSLIPILFDNKDLLFFLAYGIWLTMMILTSSFYEPYIAGIRRTCTYSSMLLLLLYELCYGKWNGHDFIAVCFLLVFFVSFANSDKNALMQAALFIFCSRRICFERLARFSLILMSALVALIIASSIFGIIQNYTVISSLRVRAYLGFRYALYPSEYLFAITALFITLKKGRIKLYQIIILLLLNFYVFAMTNSRLAFGSSLILIAAITVLTKFTSFTEASSDIWKYVCYLAFPVAALISIAITASYAGEASMLAPLDGDKIFAGRLSMGKEALDSYGVTLFGQEVLTNGASVDGFGQRDWSIRYFYIDNLYVQLLVRYGFVAFIVFISLMTAATIRTWRMKKSYLVLILIIIAVHSMVQDYTFLLSYNPFLFLLGELAVEPRSTMQTGQESDIYLKTPGLTSSIDAGVMSKRRPVQL